jgi:DNA-binding HxlR family transcriptional regulator
VPDAGPRSGQALAAREASETEYAAEHQFRSGGYVLSLLSKALNGLVLRALADGPLRLAELRRRVGGPAQSTLRGNLDTLIEIGALEKRSDDGRANASAHALTPVGAELLAVVDVVDGWLARAPKDGTRLESAAGKGATKALVRGWDSTMLRALAVRPFSLTELDNLINAYSYPALERRLAAMRLAGFVTPVRSNGATPYAITDWLRQAMAPVLAAIRCERRHLAETTAPLTRIDVETILLLIVPLIEPAPGATGVSQLSVHGGDDSDWRAAGVRLSIDAGQVLSCTSKLESGAESWIRGSAADWLEALVRGDSAELEVNGDRALTVGIVDRLHRGLFQARSS